MMILLITFSQLLFIEDSVIFLLIKEVAYILEAWIPIPHMFFLFVCEPDLVL